MATRPYYRSFRKRLLNGMSSYVWSPVQKSLMVLQLTGWYSQSTERWIASDRICEGNWSFQSIADSRWNNDVPLGDLLILHRKHLLKRGL